MAASDLIVITGPTASGKTALAVELALRFNGEIVCADSRTVYRGMDVGTAKPNPEERAMVRHHVLDVVDPDERYSVTQFQDQARAAIDDIRSKGKVPFLVGGSGLYIDSVILDYKFTVGDQSKRKEYEKKSVDELLALLKKRRISIPKNQQNTRHLVRALELGIINNNRAPEPENGTVVVAIATEKTERDERIRRRADEIFAGPIIAETKKLMLEYGKDHESMTGNIYPIVGRYLDGEITLDEAKELFVIKDRQLAKRQITWLKRHDFVKWMTLAEARIYLHQVLSSTSSVLE